MTTRPFHPPFFLAALLALAGLWSVAGAQTTQPSRQDSPESRKAMDYFINGTSLQLQGNRHAEAILEFQQSLRYDSSATTLRAMARSYAALRKFDLAEETMQRAIAFDSSSAESWELLAEIMITQGRYDEALTAYERLRGLAPTKRQLYTLGRLYEPRSADKAIEVFEQLVAIDPDESVLRRLADLYARTRQSEKRTWTLERAAKIDPTNADIAAELASIYVSTDRFEALDSILRQWSMPASSTAGENVWLAAITSFLDDTLATVSHATVVNAMLDSAMKRDGRQWRVLVAGGALALRMEDTERARSMLTKAVRSVKGISDVAISAAQTYMSFQRYQEAYDVLAHTLVSFPYDPRFLYMMGFCMQQLDADSVAVQFYRRAIGVDSLYLDAWIQLGAVYDGMGLAERSDSAYERALLIDPDNHLANNNYAYSLSVRNKDLVLARSMSWRALQQYPSNPAYLDTYGWVLYQLGEFDKARTYLERCIARGGGNATHYEHLGDVMEQLGFIDEAVHAWQEAMRRDPERTSLQNKISKYR